MNNKLQGKDLINIGIFTAIYFIVIFAAASIGFIPIFIPLISVIVPLVGGIPMMLFFSKIKKFGMLTICGVLLGIIMLLTGMGWWCIPTGLIFGLISDFMMKACDYKNAKREEQKVDKLIAEHMCAEHAGDGEGATHLITCEVTHAPDLKTARAVSRSVVCSNLFKAAVFGRDANWGRILCAIGYTPGDFSIDKVCVWLSSAAGEVYVCENAAYHPYSEDEAAKVLAEHDILVKVDMGTGDASAKAWGCDLTYDYVKINGDYRT